MSQLKKVTISVPDQLFEAGLTEAQIHGWVHRWLVVSLFQENKLTLAEASRLLMTDPAGFLALLDNLGVLYQNLRDDHNPFPLVSPVLAKLEQTKSKLAAVEEELAELKYRLYETEKALRQADRVKSEFVATVSHELRTPLNSIIGFTKLLLNQAIGPLNEIQHTNMSVIYSSAQHLLSLVNDILDLSKIDAGKIRLDMAWISIEEIIVGVIPATMILIEGKPIELREEIAPNLPKVYVDRGRIRQVVLNLLSNAAKFTDGGCIALTIDKIIEDGKEFVRFSVADTGIGIAQEDAAKVFEAFRQIDSSVARRAEGTGLGMPISVRLVELHGGRLWFESKVGVGSTFYFTLPVQPPKYYRAEVVHAEAKE